MKIYISGPITGIPEYESLVAFNNMEDRIARAGHTPVNPRRTSGWGLTWNTYMKIAQDILYSGEIDAVVLLKGWEKSKGATIEKTWAEANGIQIIYQPRTEEAKA